MNLTLPPQLIDELIDTLADRVVARLGERGPTAATENTGYLDVEQAADYLACKPARIYELKASRRLAFFNEGRRLLFRREDLDACLERGDARSDPRGGPAKT